MAPLWPSEIERKAVAAFNTPSSTYDCAFSCHSKSLQAGQQSISKATVAHTHPLHQRNAGVGVVVGSPGAELILTSLSFSWRGLLVRFPAATVPAWQPHPLLHRQQAPPTSSQCCRTPRAPRQRQYAARASTTTALPRLRVRRRLLCLPHAVPAAAAAAAAASCLQMLQEVSKVAPGRARRAPEYPEGGERERNPPRSAEIWPGEALQWPN